MPKYNLEEVRLLTETSKETMFSDKNKWIGFLKSSAFLYKYDFENQISLYALSHKARKGPDGIILANLTACASAEQWKRLGANIKENAAGISIIKNGKLVDVYDISETDSAINIWKPYDTAGFNSVLAKNMNVSEQDFKAMIDERISRFVKNSEFAKNWAAGQSFQANSIKLIVYTRCGIDTNDIDTGNMFYNVIFKDNLELAENSIISPAKDILKEIERSVREYENIIKDMKRTEERIVEEETIPQSAVQARSNGGKSNRQEIARSSKQKPKPKHRSFTHNEIQIARETNLVDFLSRQGEDLKPVGTNEFTMKTHDSMRINGSKFYWNSQSIGGNALDFCMKYYGMSFRDSVTRLLDYNGYNLSEDLSEHNTAKSQTQNRQAQAAQPRQQEQPKKESKPEPPKEPIPNQLDTKTNRVYAYLTQTRGISPSIVSELIADGIVAQDTKGNAVFKIFDEEGNLSGAEINGTNTERRFKELTERTGNTFVINPNGKNGKMPESAIFFESAIDAISFYNLHRNESALLVSMAGLKQQAVLNTIKRYGIKAENCLVSPDNDEVGIKFAQKMKNDYNISAYPITADGRFDLYENIKDWNDLLRAEAYKSRTLRNNFMRRYFDSDKIFAPNLAVDEMNSVADEFFIYENSWHTVDKSVADVAERYRNGEDIYSDIAKAFGRDAFTQNIFLTDEEETKNGFDSGYIEFSAETSDDGVTFKYEDTEQFFTWEDFGKGQFDYIKNSYKKDLLRRAEEYPEDRDKIDKLLLRLDDNYIYVKNYIESDEIFTPMADYNECINIAAEFYYYENSEHNVTPTAAKLAERFRNGEDISVDLEEYLGYESTVRTPLGTVDLTVKESEKGIAFSYGGTERFFTWEDFGKGQIEYFKNYFIDYVQDLYYWHTMPVIDDYGTDLNDWENSTEGIREEERLRNLLSKLDGKEIVLNPVGDFYEIYGESAQTAAEILGLNLTQMEINGVKTPMVGFPKFTLNKNEKILTDSEYTVNVKSDTEKINAAESKAETVLSEKSMPDNSITAADRNKYGYTSDELLPLNTEKALELFDKGMPVYFLYDDNTEALVENKSDIERFDGIFGIEVNEWEKSLQNEQNLINTPSADKPSLPFSVGDNIFFDNGNQERLWTVTNIDTENNRVSLSRYTGGISIPQEYVNTSIDEVTEYVNTHGAELNALKTALENHEPVYIIGNEEILHNPRIEYTDADGFRIASDVEYNGLPAIHTRRLGNLDVLSLIKYIKDEGYKVDYYRLGLTRTTNLEVEKDETEVSKKEAFTSEYIYKMEANPKTTSRADLYFIQSYVIKENGKADIGDILYFGTSEKCQELMEKLKAGEMTQAEVKELYTNTSQSQNTAKQKAESKPQAAEAAQQEQKSERKTGIIGNITYKYISKKTYRKFDNETAEKIASAFEAAGIKFSGKVGDETTTLTFSGNDIEKAQALIDDITKEASNEKEQPRSAAQAEPDFAEQTDKALNNELPFYTSLKVCETPQILLDIGYRQLPMLYTQRHLKDSITEKRKGHVHKHGLTAEQIKKLPELLENPVMIYDSLKRDDSIIVVTSEFDKEGLPVIVSIMPNGKGRYESETIDCNFITSVHGRENFKNQFIKAVSDDKMLFCDKQKSQELFERWGLQLSELTNSLDYNVIIHQSRSIVKKNQKNSAEKSEKSAPNGIIGNTEYKYISRKTYRKFDNVTAEKIAVAFEEAGLKFSGRVGEKNTTLTFSGNDIEKAQALIERIKKAEPEKENNVQNEQEKSSIHFGLLGNGITAYDVSREKNNDYLTIAHISNEGIVNYYVDDLKDSDKELIQKEADRQKVVFTEDWNKNGDEIKYDRILSAANTNQLIQITSDMISMEDKVKKYERSVIFKDETFPTEFKSNVIGNTPNRDIQKRHYDKFDNEADYSNSLAEKIGKAFDEASIKYSGRIMKGFTTIAFSENDVKKAQAVIEEISYTEKKAALASGLSDFINNLDSYEQGLLKDIGRTDLVSTTAEEMEKYLNERSTVQNLLDFLDNMGRTTTNADYRNTAQNFRQGLLEIYSKTYVPLYKNTVDYAREHGELDAYRVSNRENLKCRNALGDIIINNFDTLNRGRFTDGIVDNILEQFGVERVSYVLASTVKHKSYDLRFSRQNREWADTIDTSFRSPNSVSEILNTHSTILNSFIDLYRQIINERTQEKEISQTEEQENKEKYSLMSDESAVDLNAPVSEPVENITLGFSGDKDDILQMKDFALSLGCTVRTVDTDRIVVFADNIISDEIKAMAGELGVFLNENLVNTEAENNLPNIICEYTENDIFEKGKTYSVAEFDRLMREADKEFTDGKEAAIRFYGSMDAWDKAELYGSEDRFNRFLSYDKVKFTVNMPDGSKITERQDIGDGDGGVIDFLRSFEEYRPAADILEAYVNGSAMQTGLENDAQNEQNKTAKNQRQYPMLTRDMYETEKEDRLDFKKKKVITGSLIRIPLKAESMMYERLVAAGVKTTEDSLKEAIIDTDGRNWNKLVIPDKYGNVFHNIDVSEVLGFDEMNVYNGVVNEIFGRETGEKAAETAKEANINKSSDTDRVSDTVTAEAPKQRREAVELTLDDIDFGQAQPDSDKENKTSVFTQSFSQDITDLFLIHGSNTENGRLVTASEFMKQKSTEEIAESLKSIYHGGFGIQTGNRTVSAWYGEDGIHLASGKTARYNRNAQVIPWNDAAQRIGRLLSEGKFASNAELAEADSFEREQLSADILYLYRDLSDEGQNLKLFSSVSSVFENGAYGFPNMQKSLSENLNNSGFRKALSSDLNEFKEAYRQNPDVMRFRPRNVDRIEKNLRELEFPRRIYETNMSAVPSADLFITDDEINEDLIRGSGFENGKSRIYTYFTENHTTQEKANFLKNEYGTGGHSHALSGAVYSGQDHDSNRITYKKAGCAEVNLNWRQVAVRIDELVKNNRYIINNK
ncbi:MAG: DUF3849 domain-containing protein [Clostridiales bacterium]|nr:DUF3849 domain-containing protein [Clostridiales bacterium]